MSLPPDGRHGNERNYFRKSPSPSVGKRVLASGIVGGFKRRRFVYEPLGYPALVERGEYLGSFYATGGIQFAPRRIQPLIHSEG